MKRFFWLVAVICIMALSCATHGDTRKTVVEENPTALMGALTLDAALGEFSVYMAGRVPGASLTAVAITEPPVQRLSNYVADELTNSLLNEASLRMVSRQDFERIVSEQNIQANLNFNDDTTAKIGHNLGWQTIIFGAVEPLPQAYYLSLRAVDVETGELKGSKSYMLHGGDPILINLVNPNVSVQRLSERKNLLEPFDGKRNDFLLTVSTNKTVYYDNEEMSISLSTNEDCYFVVYHLDIDNNMQVIFPNRWEKDTNFLRAGTTRVIPENTKFVLHAPYGEERIMAYASVNPIVIPDDQYRSMPVTQDLVRSGSGGDRGLSVTPRSATGQVSYTILPGK